MENWTLDIVNENGKYQDSLDVQLVYEKFWYQEMESWIIYQKARYQESPEETSEYKKGGTKKIMLKN